MKVKQRGRQALTTNPSRPAERREHWPARPTRLVHHQLGSVKSVSPRQQGMNFPYKYIGRVSLLWRGWICGRQRNVCCVRFFGDFSGNLFIKEYIFHASWITRQSKRAAEVCELVFNPFLCGSVWGRLSFQKRTLCVLFGGNYSWNESTDHTRTYTQSHTHTHTHTHIHS